MPRQIYINHPGDGEWVMQRAGGVFNTQMDHCIALHRDGVICGGVAFTGFIGSAICVHMAGNETNWATRDFLWMVYDYSFNQLGVRKLLGAVAANNSRALAINLRMGFHIAAKLPDMMPDGDDLLLVLLDRKDAKWLRVKPRHHVSLLAS